MGADHTAGIDYRDSLSSEGQVKRSRDAQLLNATIDSLGYCFLAMPTKGQLMYEVLAKLLNARYGKNLKEEDVMNIGINTIKDELAFNHSAGWSDAQNRLPGFMETEKLPPNDVVFDVQQEEIDTIFKDLG
jgi:aldehyde:ferredoxin oxidoreductase